MAYLDIVSHENHVIWRWIIAAKIQKKTRNAKVFSAKKMENPKMFFGFGAMSYRGAAERIYGIKSRLDISCHPVHRCSPSFVGRHDMNGKGSATSVADPFNISR